VPNVGEENGDEVEARIPIKHKHLDETVEPSQKRMKQEEDVPPHSRESRWVAWFYHKPHAFRVIFAISP